MYQVLHQSSRKQSSGSQAQLDVGGALIALQLQTESLRPGSLALLNVNLMHAHLHTYSACIQSGNETNKSQTHNYVSPSAENGPAMTSPAGPVPAPMSMSKTEPHVFPTAFQIYMFEQLQLHTCNNSYAKNLDSANSRSISVLVDILNFLCVEI